MEQLVNFIIRPPRAEYNPKNDLLDDEFVLKGKWYQRKDLEVVNSRGDTLQCSHYMPIVRPEGNPLPCVIYCHGNSGCRTDASEAAIILLPSNITVFTLDFSGSGLSGGEHVTLGWNEKDDLKAVVDYLRADGNISLIGLWGRSMGAVTSLMYGADDPSIAGMVLDSPFSDLVDLMMELVDTYKVRIPKFTVKFAIQYMRRAIQKKAKFDITDLNAIKVAKSCFVPVLFGHATDDDFIQPHHSDRIFDAYVGDKNIIKFEGDHNSPRPQFYFDSISIFFNNVLRPPEDEVGSAYFDLTHHYVPKGSWSNIQELEISDDLLDSPTGPETSSSTEDAIRKLRSRRPMSMMVVPSDISSKDKQPDVQVDSRGSDSEASSSNMISFELSGLNPHGSHVPLSINDDEYVEYPLDTLADFPSNVEEEERMLMVAVLESLKDMKTKSPPVEELLSIGGDKPEPKLSPINSVLQVDSAKPEPASMSAAEENSKPASKNLESDAKQTCVPSDPSMHIDTNSNNPKEPFIVFVKQPHYSDSGGETNEAVKTSGDDKNKQLPNQADVADQTTVTVKVEKNQTSMMDGLLRRWDLSFFRNR
ncbi:alpha/beta-Hydrolases superfamily protein [Striga hermonthica]|uniref:Alpha/beta-Hydrolases superfamily protein n=1 Tax=Striga hermonthica TaxID=68872 RepID=A0A9N7NAY0_STRHE|nr:alpha/beta-Hydrolases superfamily protein [Striga hermonthica]